MLLMAMVPEIPAMPTVPVMAGMEATPVQILVVFQLAALVDVGFLLEALEAHKLLQLVARQPHLAMPIGPLGMVPFRAWPAEGLVEERSECHRPCVLCDH